MYNLLHRRLNSNSRTGAFSLFGKKYFFKILKGIDYAREIRGYDAVRNYYPVPYLLRKFKLLNYGVLLFSYEFSIDVPGGQVVDFFSDVTNDCSGMERIFCLYASVFTRTLTCATGSSADVFYRERVHSRLEKWYTPDILQSLQYSDVTLNGTHIQLESRVYIKEAHEYFSKMRMYPCVISQCDPQDLNLGTKPIVFDYLAGGLTPLVAEYASYLWFNIGLGNYLAPLLNPKTYNPTSKIFDCLDDVVVHTFGDRLTVQHVLSKKRRWAIREYTSTVIDPLTRDYPSWRADLLQHLTLRVLAVFNLTEEQHRTKLLFALVYLGFFRELVAETPIEFVDQLLSIYE